MTFLSRRRRACALPSRAADAGVAAPPAPPIPRSTSGRRSRGQALVEFALIVPVMLLLLLIAIDFGRLFFSYVQIHNAAREAASYGSHAPTNTAGMTNVAAQETNSQSQVGES